MQTKVTVTHVEMNNPPTLPAPDDRLDVRRAWVPNPAFNRFMYATVGAQWCWYERLQWNYDKWQQLLSDPGYQTWIAYHRDSPAGYVELDLRANGGDVEIAYFGLLPEFVGQGLGSAFINTCLGIAWKTPGTTRVWLHTCSLDHPRALANYLNAGFTVFKTETLIEDLPEEPFEIWPSSTPTKG